MPRHHKSSWVVAIATLVICALIVLPGQITDNYIPPNPNFSHGWPATFLERDVDDTQWTNVDGMSLTPSINWAILDPPSTPPWLSWDSWRFWHAKGIVWKPLNLLLDTAVMIAIVAVVTAAWEFRRRRRGNAFQFRLIEFFVATALVACVLAWMHSYSVAHWEEVKAIEAAGLENSVGFRFPYEQCVAPVWLQRLIGPGSFPQCFYRIHELLLDLDPQDEREVDNVIAFLQRLEYLNSVYISSDPNDISNELGDRIREQLPHVEVDPQE